MNDLSNGLENCGCCEGVGRATPVEIFNRPGLAQIAYRVGTHSAFKSSMIAALSDPAFPGAGPLTTRDDSDFSIALLDAWSVSADILTFYQERLANESYLRTACQQRSVFELARLVGYQPSPASRPRPRWLTHSMTHQARPIRWRSRRAVARRAFRRRGQTAATFETSADLVARIEHNALEPQSALPVDFSKVATSLWFSGTSTNLKPGDAILFVAEDRFDDVTSTSFALRIVTQVTIDAVDKRTLVAWDRTLQQGNVHRKPFVIDPGVSPPPLHLFQPDFTSQMADLAVSQPPLSMERVAAVQSTQSPIAGNFNTLNERAISTGLFSVPSRIIDLSPGLLGLRTATDPLPFTSASKVHAYALRRKASLFGANAVDPALAPSGYTKDKGAAGSDWSWRERHKGLLS